MVDHLPFLFLKEILLMPLPKDNLLFGFSTRLTDEQKVFVDAIFDYKMVFCNAKSGSGKTTLSVACAKILEKPLLYLFSPVEEGRLGFLPGDLEEKTDEYLQPLKDALLEINELPDKAIISKKRPENNKNAWIKAMPHVYARGINIKDSVVIIDEAQNWTRGELKKVLTRIHDSCNVIVIGHSGQCDLDKPTRSGFIPYLKHYESEPYCAVCTLSHNFRGKISSHADELTW
jgi:phosphate starvation-inducible protein PhoH